MRSTRKSPVRAQSPHPALRWVTLADGMVVAHRFLLADWVEPLARCGVPGPFTRAGQDKDLCRVCYPVQEKTTNRYRRG